MGVPSWDTYQVLRQTSHLLVVWVARLCTILSMLDQGFLPQIGRVGKCAYNEMYVLKPYFDRKSYDVKCNRGLRSWLRKSLRSTCSQMLRQPSLLPTSFWMRRRLRFQSSKILILPRSSQDFHCSICSTTLKMEACLGWWENMPHEYKQKWNNASYNVNE